MEKSSSCLKWCLNGKKQYSITRQSSVSIGRLADIDLGIVSNNLMHQYDVDLFSKRIEDLFDRYQKENMERFMAPCFSVVQSSGMGKTKLLYEIMLRAKQSCNTEYSYMFLLCSDGVRSVPYI